MIEPVAAERLVDRVAEAQIHQLSEPPRGTVSAVDQVHFENILHADARAVTGPQEVKDPSADFGIIRPGDTTSDPVGVPRNTIGDSVLEGVERLRTQFNDSVGKVIDTINARGNPSPTDMLQLQFEITQMSLSMNLFTREVGAIDEKIDTLLKSQ